MPTAVRIDAWIAPDTAVEGTLAANPQQWSQFRAISRFSRPMLPSRISKEKWEDWRVGWSLILAHNPKISQDELAWPSDAPLPVQRLWEKRGKPPIFRYDKNAPSKRAYLRRYAPGTDPPVQDLDPTGSDIGLGPGRVPYYLLIYGPPDNIPWEVQFSLNPNRAVGRLDIEGDGLDRYVRALLTEWKGEKNAMRFRL